MLVLLQGEDEHVRSQMMKREDVMVTCKSGVAIPSIGNSCLLHQPPAANVQLGSRLLAAVNY